METFFQEFKERYSLDAINEGLKGAGFRPLETLEKENDLKALMDAYRSDFDYFL
jgi:hypothetical protein